MKAMILAAGEGRRLRPLTERLPKPLLPVAGRPLLAHLIELLRAHGVSDIAINVHHRAGAIVACLGDGRRMGVRITYSPEERLLGSAGGVKRMERYFGGDLLFVLCGDVLTDLNLSAMLAFHNERRSQLTMALYEPRRINDCGVARMDADGRIVQFVEKPAPGREPSGWANAGVYILEPPVLGHIPSDRPFDFASDLFPLLIDTGAPVYGYPSEALVLDIGTPERYRLAQSAYQPVGRVA